MSTVDEKIARDIIRGKYADDRPNCIVRYKNAFDGSYAYGVTFMDQPKNRYSPSPYVIDPVVFWDESDGYNTEGVSQRV